MAALLDLSSRLPRTLWYEPDARAHDQRWWPHLLAALPAGALLALDLGWANFRRFAELTAARVTFVTRAKRNLAHTPSSATWPGPRRRARRWSGSAPAPTARCCG